MRPGTLLKRFNARDGTKVKLRAPRWEDLDDLLELINGLVEEEAMIAANQKHTRESENDWLARTLTNLEKDNHVALVAEADGRVVGICELTPRFGRMSQVGSLGISIKDDYREKGIGQEMMKELERQASRLGLESIYLEVFSNNDRAIHVYGKMGYVETGRIPACIKYRGGYVDSVIMTKHLAV